MFACALLFRVGCIEVILRRKETHAHMPELNNGHCIASFRSLYLFLRCVCQGGCLDLPCRVLDLGGSAERIDFIAWVFSLLVSLADCLWLRVVLKARVPGKIIKQHPKTSGKQVPTQNRKLHRRDCRVRIWPHVGHSALLARSCDPLL